jgi:signal peptidase I
LITTAWAKGTSSANGESGKLVASAPSIQVANATAQLAMVIFRRASIASISRQQRRGGGRLSDTAVTLLKALLIALVIRSLLFQPFSIPSGSMEPTLLIGDYLFVSKFSYGYSRYSFPFSPPLFWGRVLATQPTRGDIVVFRHRSDDFIKRVIGLPGDRI